MEIMTKTYGKLDINEKQQVNFPKGLLGFSDFSLYAIIDSSQPPFFHLQSLEDPGLSFIILSPDVFRPDFTLDIDPQELDDLKWEEDEELLVMAIVTIPRDGKPMTANLQGPLVINRNKRIGKQVIQTGSKWLTRHNIIEEMSTMGEGPC
jgi:flagellar assembly factor FliW